MRSGAQKNARLGRGCTMIKEPSVQFGGKEAWAILGAGTASVVQELPFSYGGVALAVVVDKEAVAVAVMALLVVVGDDLQFGVELNSPPVGSKGFLSCEFLPL